MIVVGGVYSEYCYHPAWHQIFGSGGRGAAVLTRLGVSNVALTTCVAPDALRAVGATLIPYDVDIHSISSDSLYEFTYTHPLSEPFLKPFPPHPANFSEAIQDEVVLAYGMLEGMPHVQAKSIIYDPQSETDILRPSEFVDNSERLALVLNERELEMLCGTADMAAGAQAILHANEASVVIVKQGPFGCIVADHHGTYSVPVFPTRTVFKIGSGDVFSAAFAKFWALDGMSPLEAAQDASRCASLYCETKSIDAVSRFKDANWTPREKRRRPAVYLAGPFFSLAQRFLVEEARRSLIALGAKVFSPMHEVGIDAPPAIIAKEDLKGLEESTVVLALIADLDPGTIFEIGFARARNIPVVAYGEGIKEEHLTMLVGSECFCSDDFCSALYNAIWAGM
jgi:hypothetical protein